MVEDAGADIVDINFGCPVRKVTKTGAGATLLDDPERACRIVAAVAEAVDVPVTVKMRRGLENGSRACLDVGPRLVEAGAATLTLHPRSAKQMYTGTADHSLTAELVELVDVPVIASGDVTSRARAQAVLAHDRRRGGDGRPRRRRATRGRCARSSTATSTEPTREEVAAELILFIRETVRELGERARVGLPEEVLRLVPRPRPLPAAVQAGARAARDDSTRWSSGCSPPPRAPPRCSSGSRPSCPTARTTSCSSCRSRSTAAAEPLLAVQLPDEPKPLERQERVDALESSARAARSARRGRRSRPSAPRRRARRGSARRSRPPGRRSRRRARTGARAAVVLRRSRSRGSTKSTLTSRAARAKSASIETSIPGASTPPTYSPSGETTSKFVEVPKSTTMHGAPYRSPRRDRVRDPVGPDLARVVVADRDPGLTPGPSTSSWRVAYALGERLVLADELRHRRGRAQIPSTRVEVEEAAVRARRARRRVRCASVAIRQCSRSSPPVEEPEDRLGVPDVDARAASRGLPGLELVVASGATRRSARRAPRRSACGSSPSPRSSSTVTSLEV